MIPICDQNNKVSPGVPAAIPVQRLYHGGQIGMITRVEPAQVLAQQAAPSRQRSASTLACAAVFPCPESGLQSEDNKCCQHGAVALNRCARLECVAHNAGHFHLCPDAARIRYRSREYSVLRNAQSQSMCSTHFCQDPGFRTNANSFGRSAKYKLSL